MSNSSPKVTDMEAKCEAYPQEIPIAGKTFELTKWKAAMEVFSRIVVEKFSWYVRSAVMSNSNPKVTDMEAKCEAHPQEILMTGNCQN